MSESAEVGNWIQAGATVLGFMVLWLKLSGKGEKRDIGPQPFEVKPVAEYADRNHTHHQYITRDECRAAHLQQSQNEAARYEAIQRHIDNLGNKIDVTLADHNKQAEERASKLHLRLDPVSNLAQATSARVDDHLKAHLNGSYPHAT